VVVTGFNYDTFTFFKSKKIPLKLEGINAHGGENIVTLFKNGDDLRQDILTIQLIYIMDKIWLDSELDL